jgi:hypothetical protein
MIRLNLVSVIIKLNNLNLFLSDLNLSDAVYAYLSVIHSDITLFPTTSCLNNKLQWADMTAGINTPGKENIFRLHNFYF